MSYRNLEAVRFIIKEATGLDITYAYEDLVFPEHAAFIFQFDEKSENKFFCYFHVDCNMKDKEEIFTRISEISSENKYKVENKGIFKLQQKGEDVEVSFSYM